MRILVMVVAAVVLGCAAAAGGFYLGEYAPGGVAALGAPFSEIRDAEAAHYAYLGGALGAFVGMILGGVVRLSSDDRNVGRSSTATGQSTPEQDELERATRSESIKWLSVVLVVVGVAVLALVMTSH